MTELTKHDLLLTRTLARNAQIWQDLDSAQHIPSLTDYEAIVNDVHYYDVYQWLDMALEDYRFQVALRDDLYDVDVIGLDAERKIARDKYDTRIQVISLDTAGKKLLLAADEYDARVRDAIMAAKEYMAAVQNKELWLEKDRAEMAVDREEAKLKEIQAKLMLEQYERKQVEVQIARAQLDAAKAAVQVIMAEIAKEQAKIRIVEAQVQAMMAEVDKATLQADVATILAEIVTKGLAKIRLEVEQAELIKGYEWLELWLEDMLNQWDKKQLAIEFQANAEETVGKEIDGLTIARKALEDLTITKIESEEDLWDWEKAKLEAIKAMEEIAKEEAFNAKKEYEAAKSAAKILLDKKSIWAEALLNVARKWTYLNGHTITHNTKYLTQIIHQGIAGTPGYALLQYGDACGE